MEIQERQNTGMLPPAEMLDCISETFMKYGLRSTSMDDICKQLHIAKKTLYAYFENKDQVVEAVMLHRHKQVDFDDLANQIDNHSAIHILLGTVDYFNTAVPRHNQAASNIYDLKKYHPATHEKVTAQVENFIIRYLDIVVKKGIEQGHFRKNIDVDLRIWLTCKELLFWFDPENMEDAKFAVSDIFCTMIENFIRSMATLEGLKLLETEKKNFKAFRSCPE